ncbi:uncharacterized protein LOC132696409 [Cylas formicarius]|uniref:uncharacterized protein LOC132696409 n=1 Tax=Cylas formicarius TaxID=197179 RepID=UPI002958A895|nr:uncharacterized protein LOC132696409 [Cylas formicarius]
MKSLLLVLVIFTVVEIQCKPSPCAELKAELEKQCQSTRHENYIECIRRHRKKRSLSCSDSEDNEVPEERCDCDCDSCRYSKCGGTCNNCCSRCCDDFVPCRTNHCCHKTCHAECRTSSCRSTCRKSCYENLSQGSSVNAGSASGSVSVNASNINNNLPNVTTIIHVQNVINQSNIIDVPINLGYTSKNNISIIDGSGNGTSENCCIVIGPRQCFPTNTYPFTKCYHTRAKQCGWYCTASIVHEEQQEICQRDVLGQPINCQQEKTYIPQPQPRCTYTSSWPYVWCGIQKPASCEGCYNHYFNSDSKEYHNCSPQCYDEGFGVGPYYRQGPFYQQSFSHVPPCSYSPSGCGAYGDYGGAPVFGGYPGYYGAAPSYGGFGFQPGYGSGMGLTSGYGYAPQIRMPAGPFSAGFPSGPPLPWNFDSVKNLTAFNNKTGLFNPIIDTMPVNGGVRPFYDLPDKEVEIDVDIAGPTTRAPDQPPPA